MKRLRVPQCKASLTHALIHLNSALLTPVPQSLRSCNLTRLSRLVRSRNFLPLFCLLSLPPPLLLYQNASWSTPLVLPVSFMMTLSVSVLTMRLLVKPSVRPQIILFGNPLASPHLTSFLEDSTHSMWSSFEYVNGAANMSRGSGAGGSNTDLMF